MLRTLPPRMQVWKFLGKYRVQERDKHSIGIQSLRHALPWGEADGGTTGAHRGGGITSEGLRVAGEVTPTFSECFISRFISSTGGAT